MKSEVITSLPSPFGGKAVISSSPQKLKVHNVKNQLSAVVIIIYQRGRSLLLWAFSSCDTKIHWASGLTMEMTPFSSSRTPTHSSMTFAISGRNLSCRSSTTSARSWPSTYAPFLHSFSFEKTTVNILNIGILHSQNELFKQPESRICQARL